MVTGATRAALNVVAAAAILGFIDHDKQFPSISVVVFDPDFVLYGPTTLDVILGNLHSNTDIGEPVLKDLQHLGRL